MYVQHLTLPGVETYHSTRWPAIIRFTETYRLIPAHPDFYRFPGKAIWIIRGELGSNKHQIIENDPWVVSMPNSWPVFFFTSTHSTFTLHLVAGY